jgi:integrative and conjugative element protein (TIGR02256 family)
VAGISTRDARVTPLLRRQPPEVAAGVWIAGAATAAIKELAGERYALETGGIVVGYMPPDSRDPVVTGIIGPGPHAHHRAKGFKPDAAWQEQRVAEVYEASGRVITYHGDWHSHPEARA